MHAFGLYPELNVRYILFVPYIYLLQIYLILMYFYGVNKLLLLLLLLLL